MGWMDGLRQAEADAKLQPQLQRFKKAQRLLVYLVGLTDQPSLLSVPGNRDILKNKSLSHNNSATHAQLAAYDADYEESKICAAICEYGVEDFMETITPELASSQDARTLLTWWENHQTEDTKRLTEEIQATHREIQALETDIEEHKAELHELLKEREALK